MACLGVDGDGRRDTQPTLPHPLGVRLEVFRSPFLGLFEDRLVHLSRMREVRRRQIHGVGYDAGKVVGRAEELTELRRVR